MARRPFPVLAPELLEDRITPTLTSLLGGLLSTALPAPVQVDVNLSLGLLKTPLLGVGVQLSLGGKEGLGLGLSVSSPLLHLEAEVNDQGLTGEVGTGPGGGTTIPLPPIGDTPVLPPVGGDTPPVLPPVGGETPPGLPPVGDAPPILPPVGGDTPVLPPVGGDTPIPPPVGEVPGTPPPDTELPGLPTSPGGGASDGGAVPAPQATATPAPVTTNDQPSLAAVSSFDALRAALLAAGVGLRQVPTATAGVGGSTAAEITGAEALPAATGPAATPAGQRADDDIVWKEPIARGWLLAALEDEQALTEEAATDDEAIWRDLELIELLGGDAVLRASDMTEAGEAVSRVSSEDGREAEAYPLWLVGLVTASALGAAWIHLRRSRQEQALASGMASGAIAFSLLP